MTVVKGKNRIFQRFKELYLTSEALPVGRVKRMLRAEGFDRRAIRETVNELLNEIPGPVKAVEVD